MVPMADYVARSGGKGDGRRWEEDNLSVAIQISSDLASKIWRRLVLQLVGYDIMATLDEWNLTI